MEFINSAFFFITDKTIELQGFFLNFARYVAFVAITVTVVMTAFNYAMLGTGLKENIIKFTKALLFYSVVIFAYPNIVGWITNFSFTLARDSTLPAMSAYLQTMQTGIQEESMRQMLDNEFPTYGGMAMQQGGGTAAAFFGQGIIAHRTFTTSDGRTFHYSTVAPKAALAAILIVAGEWIRFATVTTAHRIGPATINIPNIGHALIGIIVALVVIFVGLLAVFEYLVAFIEFMLLAAVGLILFPLTLFEGTKSYSDTFIKAMFGHFLKLLFCTIVIFLVLYGFLSLANTFTLQGHGVVGTVDQILMVLATSILLMFIAKAAPSLASALITGSPSLTGGSVIRTVTSAVAAAGAVGAMAMTGGKAALMGGKVAGSIANKAGSAVLQAGGAASTAMNQALPGAGSVGMLGMRTFAGSMGNQMVAPIKKAGSDLVGSLKTGWHSRTSRGKEYGQQQVDYFNYQDNPMFRYAAQGPNNSHLKGKAGTPKQGQTQNVSNNNSQGGNQNAPGKGV